MMKYKLLVVALIIGSIISYIQHLNSIISDLKVTINELNQHIEVLTEANNDLSKSITTQNQHIDQLNKLIENKDSEINEITKNYKSSLNHKITELDNIYNKLNEDRECKFYMDWLIQRGSSR